MRIPADGNYVPVVLFGCLHMGSKDQDIKLATAYRDFVRHHPTAKAILLGDNFDACIPCHKPETMWNQRETPGEQLDMGMEFYTPIKDRILGGCTSNHSERIWKATSLELDKLLARDLGYLETGYVGVLGQRKFKLGQVSYNVAMSHGQSAGMDEWRDAKKVLSIYPDVDVVMLSHTHRTAFTEHNTLDRHERRKEVYFARTGSVLNYPRYAMRALYTPQSKGFMVLYFGTNTKEVFPYISHRPPTF